MWNIFDKTFLKPVFFKVMDKFKELFQMKLKHSNILMKNKNFNKNHFHLFLNLPT